MPDNISTAVTAAQFDRYAARGLADEAHDRKEDLRLGLQHILWALGHFKDGGAWPSYLEDLAKIAHDTITTRDAQLNKDIDADGQWAEPVDLTELEKLT